MKEMDLYNQWKSMNLEDQDLVHELAEIEGDQEAIKDRFWHYIGAVCLLVFIYVWFKGSYMKNYRKILKAEIFNIHHKWMCLSL